jgi:hypothetical protein
MTVDFAVDLGKGLGWRSRSSLVCDQKPTIANSTYSRVWVAKHLSGMLAIRNGLEQGDAVSPLHLSFTLEYAIRRVQVNQDSLKLNGTIQLTLCI